MRWFGSQSACGHGVPCCSTHFQMCTLPSRFSHSAFFVLSSQTKTQSDSVYALLEGLLCWFSRSLGSPHLRFMYLPSHLACFSRTLVAVTRVLLWPRLLRLLFFCAWSLFSPSHSRYFLFFSITITPNEHSGANVEIFDM